MDAGYYVPVQGIQHGDRMVLAVWLRTNAVQGVMNAPGELRIFCENDTTDEKDFYLPVSPSSEWQRYLIPFESKSSAPRRLGFHLHSKSKSSSLVGLR